jgi:NAD-reducing hydrogenase small subunit
MSFLDLDERLIDIADSIEIVYSPVVDVKEFPDNVDLTLVEGAIATVKDVEKIRKVREKSNMVIAFGDCAVTGNVPAMRNQFDVQDVLKRGYLENTDDTAQIPDQVIPELIQKVRPIQNLVDVDLYIPGCPPPADAIFYVLTEILEGRTPDVNKLPRFGK